MKRITVYKVEWEYDTKGDNSEEMKNLLTEESQKLPFLVFAESYSVAFSKVVPFNSKYFQVGKIELLAKNANVLE